jgi:mannonate dehydratase
VRIAEYLLPTPSLIWRQLLQIGVTDIVSELDRSPDGTHDSTGDLPWDFVPLARIKERYESAGFRLAAIEDWPPMDRVRTGRPGRDEEIEHFCTLVRNMGALGIPLLCYNWMAGVNWTRTRSALSTRGGALVNGFRESDIADAPPTVLGRVEHEPLWDAYGYFLERVLPVAEAAGVTLALHPDDPPIPRLRDVARIMIDIPAFDRALSLSDSPAHGICLCQGNFSLMTDDLPGAIRHFGADGRIAFGHFRLVDGTPTDFVEIFHDQDPDLAAACMSAWADIGFEGLVRPDHVPTLAGEDNVMPGYGELARLHAVGYLQGLRDVAYR